MPLTDVAIRNAEVQSRLNAGNTFAVFTTEYCAKRKRDGEKGWSAATALRSEYLLTQLNSGIGRMPINGVEPMDVLAAVRRIEGRGKLESARRTLRLTSLLWGAGHEFQSETFSLTDLSAAELLPAEMVKLPGSTARRMSIVQKARASGERSNRTVRFSPGFSVIR